MDSDEDDPPPGEGFEAGGLAEQDCKNSDDSDVEDAEVVGTEATAQPRRTKKQTASYKVLF